MYTSIIEIDDELRDILENGINFEVNSVGMTKDMKTLTPAQKKIYIKRHRVRDILIEYLPYFEYIKIIYKSTAKTIFESLCFTHEGNQQVKEAKANLLVQHYELFRMKGNEEIESMFSRSQVLVQVLQVLSKSYTTSDHVMKILRNIPAR